MEIYKKKINLTDAEKFLTTFKTQKPKQTCSSFIDEFIIYYENYTHQKWTKEQRTTNLEARNAEMMQLITDGICKEFKIHCDNIEYDLSKAKLDELEKKVVEWQRSTTTGKIFTGLCTQAKLPSATSSALELDDYFNTPSPNPIIEEAQTSAAQASSTASRGQRGGRGQRGAVRGARGRGISGRGANTSSAGAPKQPIISRDTLDGNHPNYRQTPEGLLYRSIHGYPLCNYCGGPSHKRQNCTVKAADREAGLTRINHPDRDKTVANQEKAKIAAAAYVPATAAALQSFPKAHPVPYQQQQQYPWPPWPGYHPTPVPNIQNPTLQWNHNLFRGTVLENWILQGTIIIHVKRT